VSPSLLTAQNEVSARDSARVLLLEHRFGPDSAASVVVTLERKVVYWVELTGSGTPVFQPLRRRPRLAFLVPIAEGSVDAPRRFEVYALQRGPHVVSLSDVPPGSVATLRLYQDVVETRRIAVKLDRQIAFGLTLATGHHSGYRLDPTGGADPRGGNDVEGCLLFETGHSLGTCLGVGRQSFPDAGFTATWVFIELQRRLVGGHFLGDRRTDLGAVLRFSRALKAGPRDLDPALLGFGLYVNQHLAAEGRRRGWRIHLEWQHHRLGEAVETERLDSNRFMAGITWIP
jgi:hypothetical protein